MDDPTRHLVEPQPVEPSISGGYVNPIEVLDLVSPTAWLNQAIADLTGYNVIEHIVKPFAGDWEAFSRFGNALRNFAPCMQDIGVNVQSQLDLVDAMWDGHASDAAYNYFNDLAAKVSGVQYVLREAADNYDKTATGIWGLAQQLGNLVQSIVDQAIIITVASAVGTALVETGVGALVGYGVAAWRLVELLKLCNRAAIIIQTAGTLITAFFSLMQEVNWRFGDLTKVGLPGASYDHPAVN
jgi:uncharacterized protein YukE